MTMKAYNITLTRKSDSNLQTLIRKLKEKGKNPSEIPIEFISEKPPRLIL